MEPIPGPGTPRPRRARILVVEDDPALRRAMEMLLAQSGWTVEVVADGRAALLVLRERVPDLVLTDVVMPGMGGFGLLRELRADPRTRALPVIFMSVIPDEDTRVKALEAGASDYLFKPFSEHELLARVSTQLERAFQRRAAAQQSEGLFQALADHAPVLLWMAGPDGLSHYFNREALVFTGLTLQEMSGYGWTQAVHPEDRPASLEAYRQAFQARQEYRRQERWRRQDGQYRWLLVKGAPRFHAGGELAGFVVAGLDLGEQGQAEVEHRQRGEEMHAILDEAAHAVIGLDAQDRITFWNPRAQEMFGWSRAEALGQDLADLIVPAEQREAHRRGLERFRESGKASLRRRLGVEGLRRDGARFPLELEINVRRHGDGYTGHAFAADVTEHRRAEAERLRLLAQAQEARAQAEAANRMKDDFLATLSHELRTPLNAIVGWVHLLRGDRLDQATAARALETIDRNAKVQTQLISDILDVSRIVSGKLRVNRRPLELAPIVEAALDTVRPAAEAKGLRLQAELDPAAGPVSGDPDRLQQVVWNLLANAIKFTSSGGRVEVELARLDSQVRLRVADDGAGIAPDFLPHVFERFRQADPSTTRPQGGLGLGLAIVRHLVEVHGGSVQAESPGLGQGSAFTVTLPLMDLAAEQSADRQRVPAIAESPLRVAGPSLEGVVVLVMDADEEARRSTTRVLRECGAQVLAAATTEQALDTIARERPDVLLTNLDARGEDGFRLIRMLREVPPTRGGLTPAAVLTDAAQDRRLEALMAGYQVHLPKPVEPAELATVVASLAGRTRDLFHG